MRQSNIYILIFTLCTTVFVGGTLAVTSIALKPRQERSIELDTKAQILGAVIDIHEGDDILKIYDQHIISLVVDSKGNEITKDDEEQPIVAEKVNVSRNYKLAKDQRYLPVFKYVDGKNSSSVEAYIIPVYGNGLWDRIWGFVALDVSLETIKGVSFGHKQETPGLGARISDDPVISARFRGKKIYNQEGKLVSVSMVKGENGKPLDAHHVDGMSGATMTGKGVNKMLKEYLSCYQAYFDTMKANQQTNL